MVNIFGYELDIVSFIPAAFGTILSAYNWYMANRSAKIFPNKFVEYGVIHSKYQESILLCLPLLFHNEGAKKGMIYQIKVGFRKSDMSEIKYIDILGKIHLHELNYEDIELIDWDKFQEKGYSFVRPTYPIVVDPGESTNVNIISIDALEDNIVPIDENSTCVIEVYYGIDNKKTTEFSFKLRSADLGEDDYLWWLRPEPIEK